MIQFDHTNQTESGQIEFVNQNGDTVKSYPLSELEQFVTDKQLNISYEHDAVGGTGMVCDPNTDFVEREVTQSVTEYIDNNWDEVTKAFYIERNPSEFKSFNSAQETRRVG